MKLHRAYYTQYTAYAVVKKLHVNFVRLPHSNKIYRT